MILELEVLNSDATLNNFADASPAKFITGSATTIVMRINQTQRKLRYVPSAAATLSMTLTNSDGTTFTVVPTFLDAGDRSLITATITAAQTASLIGQNLVVTITDGALVCTAQLAKGLQSAGLLGNC